MKTRNEVSVVAPVFTDLKEANDAMFRIGKLRRSTQALEAELQEKIAQLRKETDMLLSPILAELSKDTLSLRIYAEAHKTTLLLGKKKTIVLSGGNFGWRFTPHKVVAGRGGDKKLLEELKALKYRKYIRVKEEIDKEALLKDRPTISGVRYVQKEEFFVEPITTIEPDLHTASPIVAQVS